MKKSLQVSLVVNVLLSYFVCHQSIPSEDEIFGRIQKHHQNQFFSDSCAIFFYRRQPKGYTDTLKGTHVKEVDKIALRRWRKRGFYSENVLVKLLQKNGYNAVRVPVSNPSLNPLPDIMARKGEHSFAFEVKNATYYAYFPKQQIDKLFRFLNELVPTEKDYKHAVVAAHLGKKWTFKEICWADWEKNKLPEKVRILKRDRGNLNIAKSY